MLGDAAADLDDRRFLERVGADHRRGHLAGDGDQRNAVELGVGDGGDQIGRSGAAGGHADTGLAGRAGVALRGKTAPLLVARQNGADLVRVAGQRLVDRHAGSARIGEHHFHVVIHQRLDKNIGTVHHFVLGGLICRGHGTPNCRRLPTAARRGVRATVSCGGRPAPHRQPASLPHRLARECLSRAKQEEKYASGSV